MNIIEIAAILFIVLVVFAILVSIINNASITTMATQHYQGRQKEYKGGRRENYHRKNTGRSQLQQTLDDPRTVEKNALYSPFIHGVVYYNTKNDKYVAPNSNEQIKAIMQHGTSYDLGNLIKILAKKTDNISELLTLLGQTGGPADDVVYNSLSKVNPTGIDVSADMKRGEYMAKHYHTHVKQYLNGLSAKPRYLDIGGKEGGITLAFAKHIGADDVHVVEVDKYDTPGIKYHIVESGEESYKLPYEDDSFDVISAFMVLHHVKNLPSMISEIQRVIKPGGKLVITDHDCWDAFDAMLIDIEHLIYMVGKEGFDAKKDEWYMRYFNRGQLSELLSPLKNTAGGFVAGIKPDIAANRKFWGVYTSP